MGGTRADPPVSFPPPPSAKPSERTAIAAWCAANANGRGASGNGRDLQARGD